MDEPSRLELTAGPARQWKSDPGTAGLAGLETDAVQQGCGFCFGHIAGLTDEQKWRTVPGDKGLGVRRRKK